MPLHGAARESEDYSLVNVVSLLQQPKNDTWPVDSSKSWKMNEKKDASWDCRVYLKTCSYVCIQVSCCVYISCFTPFTSSLLPPTTDYIHLFTRRWVDGRQVGKVLIHYQYITIISLCTWCQSVKTGGIYYWCLTFSRFVEFLNKITSFVDKFLSMNHTFQTRDCLL